MSAKRCNQSESCHICSSSSLRYYEEKFQNYFHYSYKVSFRIQCYIIFSQKLPKLQLLLRNKHSFRLSTTLLKYSKGSNYSKVTINYVVRKTVVDNRVSCLTDRHSSISAVTWPFIGDFSITLLLNIIVGDTPQCFNI